MIPSPMRKKLAALATIGSLAACAPTQGPVFCHEWSASEKTQLEPANLSALPTNNPTNRMR